MLFYPERVALAGLAVYGFLWLLAPLDIVHPLAWGSLGYIGFCYVAFFGGCLLVAGVKRQVVRPQISARFTRRAFWIIALLGAIGMALRVYDKLFLRGLSIEDTAMESRTLLADAEAGPVAALAALLYPFCYVPLILWWARTPGMRLHVIAKWIAVLLLALPALDALLLLSRSLMLVALSMMYFASACLLYRGRLLHPRLVVPALVGLITVLLISVFAFSARLSEMNLDIIFSILNSAYGHVLTPNQLALSAMSDDGSVIADGTTALIPILQYYLHGLFEFGLLWDRPDTQVFTFGTHHFAPYVKALSLFGLITYSDFETAELFYRIGIFTTFFGPLWVDFGWFGLLFMAGFGALCKYCARLARNGSLAVMPLHVFFCVVLFFMPVVNFMVSAQGMYIINAFLLVWVFIREGPRRLPTHTGTPSKDAGTESVVS